jgi:hypothetical protein
VYNPPNRNPDEKLPVLIELPGNYYYLGGSTGHPDDAHLGYGLTGGQGFIWVTMPFISLDGQKNEIQWWGDEAADIAYLKRNIPRICDEYNGDPNAVFLCGFSRGAIAVSYIGLYDDEIAAIWKGFISHDHYDGVLRWGGTTFGDDYEKYKADAVTRLKRIGNRPSLIMQNPTTSNIREFIENAGVTGDFTYLDIPINEIFPVIPNVWFNDAHTDRWLLFDNEYTVKARSWLRCAAGYDHT